jgi:hypothetical protein
VLSQKRFTGFGSFDGAQIIAFLQCYPMIEDNRAESFLYCH